jgi:hypothetical protein
MLSFARSRTPRSRPASRPLHVEALERRELLYAPVGNVTAQLVGSTLLLTGDSLGNQLMVASVSGGKVAVLGVNLGTTINGATNPFVTSRPVTSIIANLNGGDDQIGFGNSAGAFADQLDELGIDPPPFDAGVLQTAINAVAAGATTFTLPGSLSITTAGGNDQIGILGTIGGSVAANLGSAQTGPGIGNGLFLGGLPDGSRVGGGVSIVGGAQADGVLIVGATIGGGVSAALGAAQADGENELFILKSSMASVAYTGGTGTDAVIAQNSGIRNGVSIVTGAGSDSVVLNTVGPQPMTVGGSVAIDTGADFDYLEFIASVRGAVSVVTGGGDDQVKFDQASVGLNAAIDTGVGNDRVEIEASQFRYNLLVSLGAGDDTLRLLTTSAFAAYLYGGPGTNGLDIDRPSMLGIRWLYDTQFVLFR